MIAEALSSLWNPRNATPENPTFSLNDPRAWDEFWGAGNKSSAGVRVTHSTAMEIGAVWQALSTISGDVASATMNCFRVDKDDDREKDWNHPAQYLVSTQPNEEMSAFEFWRRLMIHALLWQNGYAFIGRKGGRLDYLINLLPDRTESKRDKQGNLFYVTEVDGQLVPIRADQVLHVKGLSVENGKGCDLVTKARNSWGLAIAAEGFAARFFSNGAQAGGILEIPMGFSAKAKDNIEKTFKDKYTGRENWFKTIVLRDGAKFHQTMVNSEQSQQHELREDQVREVARFFNLPPFKLGLADSVSYNSAEQSQLVYLTGCLRHWFSAVQGECDIKLLEESERRKRTHYFEHNVTKLIEIDAKSMAEVLEIERRNEIINANEWRRKINLNRRDDPGGDEYVNPNTRSPDGGNGTPPANGKPSRNGALRDLFCDAANRVARRVCFDARNAAKKPQKFAAWLDGKAQEHRAVFSEAVLPVLRVIDDTAAETRGLALEGRFFGTLLDTLEPVVSPPFVASDLTTNVDSRCLEFEATIAETLYQNLKGTL